MSAAQFPIIGYAVGLLLFAWLLWRTQQYGWTIRRKVEIIVLVLAIIAYHFGQDAFLWLAWGPMAAAVVIAWGLVLFGPVDSATRAAMLLAEPIPTDLTGVNQQLSFIESLPFWDTKLDERRDQLLQQKRSYAVGGLEA